MYIYIIQMFAEEIKGSCVNLFERALYTDDPDGLPDAPKPCYSPT